MERQHGEGLAEARLMQIQGRIDRGLEMFQAETALRCPAGCGECCERTRLTITGLEARAIWQYVDSQPDLSERLQEAIEGAPSPDGEGCYRCPLYQLAGRTGCAAYPARPILCRLFGYQLVLHGGAPQFNTCLILGDGRLQGIDDVRAEQLQRAAIRRLGTNPYDVLMVDQADKQSGGDGKRRPMAEALRRERGGGPRG